MINLVIDNYPVLDVESMTVCTEFSIDSDKEISISINNSIILNKNHIFNVEDNIIELINDIEIYKEDILAVIYNKI